MGRTDTDAEVELEDRYFLGVSQVKDKPGGNSISEGKACRPCYTSVRKQAEGGRTERRVSDCDADLTVWANPMHELPSKSPTWGRNVRALVPLLCSLPGWVLPPRRGTWRACRGKSQTCCISANCSLHNWSSSSFPMWGPSSSPLWLSHWYVWFIVLFLKYFGHFCLKCSKIIAELKYTLEARKYRIDTAENQT